MSHQTAVIFDAANLPPSSRVARLLESLGGEHDTADNDNIKVDVFTLVESAGASIVPGVPSSVSSTGSVNGLDVDAWAAERGYNTLIRVSRPQA